MFKRVLVPLDGSSNAEKAIPWATTARPSLLTLIRVVDSRMHSKATLTLDIHRRSRSYLQAVKDKLRRDGFRARLLIAEGDPAQSIVQGAGEAACELIVMTTRGESKVKRWLLGGVTERVIRTATIPVLVIRSQSPLPPKRVNGILVALDGSDRAERALPIARKMARSGARVVLLHVVPPAFRASASDMAVATRVRQRTLPICDEWTRNGISTSFVAVRGDPAEEILKAARHRLDLIVTTTRGRSGPKRWVLGSVAEKLIHHAAVPVLVCPADYGEAAS